MLVGFMMGIGVAVLLAQFQVDSVIIAGMRDFFKINIGQNGYYLLMGIIGGISRVMIGGFVSGLFFAYAFTFVKIDMIIIKGMRELLSINLSTAEYYVMFGAIGAGLSLLKIVQTCLAPLFFFRKKN